MDHATARIGLATGFRVEMGRPGTVAELQVLGGIAILETNYGQAWKPPGVGSNNLGAEQSGRPPCNPASSFLYTDTHPNPDGTSTPYSICFAKFASFEDGAQHLTHDVYVGHGRAIVLAAAGRGDLHGVSAALHATGYYEGYGATVAERIAHHFAALLRAVQSIARALGEPMPDGSASPPRTLRLEYPRMMGEDVKRCQRAVGAKDDGDYGPLTYESVRHFQASRRGLGVDGVVGPATWAAIAEWEAGQVPAVQP